MKKKQFLMDLKKKEWIWNFNKSLMLSLPVSKNTLSCQILPYKHKVEQIGAILNLDFSLSFPISLKVSLRAPTLHVKQFQPE